MLVKDIMTKKVVSVERRTKISELTNIMFENRLHGIPVVEDKKVVGIITESDFFTKDSGYIFLPSYISFLKQFRVSGEMPEKMQTEVERLFDATAEDIMSSKCVTVIQDMKLSDLLEFFKTTELATFPVVDENNDMVGIVALADMIKFVKV